MLNNFNPHTFVCFFSDVFMCEQHHLINGPSYWNLRLLVNGKLVDAFQWDRAEYPLLDYKNNDGIIVSGRWTTKRKERFQVIQSRIITSFAVNDEVYDLNKQKQLEFDFGDDLNQKKED